MVLKKNDRYKATLTLFGFFRLVNVPLKARAIATASETVTYRRTRI